MNEYPKFDLVVIGGGSAAFAAALKASEMGAEVAICESGVIGGTCLNRGCIPSKNLLRAAEIFNYSRQQQFKGIEILPGKVDFAKLISQKNDLIKELREEKYFRILRNNARIHLVNGRAQFTGRKMIMAAGKEITGEKFVIATGCRPKRVPFKGIEGVDHLDSSSALDLGELPSSMTIVGGRFVALEMGQIFSRFGVKVTILQRSPFLIPNEEEVISAAIREYLEEDGICIETGVTIIDIKQSGSYKIVRAEIRGEVCEIKSESLLMATGNTPNTGSLQAELAGVVLDGRGYIKTDGYMQTSNKNIFAAGDVTGGIELVTVAAREGVVAGYNALATDGCCLKKMNYDTVPHAIFTDPNIASVGLTEKKATQLGINVQSKILKMKSIPKARTIRDTKGLIKVVAEKKTGRILGIHIVACGAAEIIHQGVLIMREKMTIEDVTEKIDVYPTMSEMIKLCAQSFFKDIGQLSCCAE